MRPPLLKRWSYSDKLEGLLLFAQVVEESLFDYTIDSFRPPALNTFYRCVELMHALGQVRRASLHPNTLAPMVEELTVSLDEDAAARALLTSHREVLKQQLQTSVSRPEELETMVNFLRARLRAEYRKSLEARLKELIKDSKEKGEIVRLTHAWITQLVNEGFSRGHIFYSVTQRFFSMESKPKIGDATELDGFFSSFDLELATWTVIFKVSGSFRTVETVAKSLRVTLADKAPAPKTGFGGEKAFLESGGADQVFALIEPIKARDSLAARNRAEGALRALTNVAHLHAHRLDLSWNPDALVYNSKTGWVTRLDEPTSHVLKLPDCPDAKIGDLTSRTLGIINRPMFEPASTTRLGQVLDLHSAALQAPTLPNQLLNFWSAIETLLPPPNEPGRIVHIVRSASPLLCRAYPIKLIKYLHDSLRGCLGAKVDNILARVPQGKNRLENVAALVSLKGNEALRDEVYALCAPNPLLRFRVFSIFKKLSTAPAIRDTLAAHRHRVEWQIQRIYRSRNLILHAGETLPYLGSLIENVHSYLDRMLDLVRHALETKMYLRSIDSALLEVGLDHAAHMDLLIRAGIDGCTPSTFLELLFGPRADRATADEGDD